MTSLYWPYWLAHYYSFLEISTIVVAVLILISSLDDLFIDLWYWSRRLFRKFTVDRKYRPLTAEQLMARLPAEKIAATLVRALRADLPAPEDILAVGGRDERGEPGPRPGFEGSTWFVINAGRRHNADPRWLLPLICRYGHVGRNDIGAIRIAANESYFEVTQRATPGFVKALRRATIAPEDEGLMIEQAPPRAEGAAAHPRPPRTHHRPRPKTQPVGARKRSR